MMDGKPVWIFSDKSIKPKSAPFLIYARRSWPMSVD